MKAFKGVAASLMASVFFATAAQALEGVYNTGRSDETGDASTLDVKFHPCAHDTEQFCGTIVAVHDPADEPGADVLPDGSPIVGFTMIKDLEIKGGGEYRSGEINAVDESLEKGKMVWYGVKIDDPADGTIKVRGCLAFICPRTMIWTRVIEN